MKQNQKRMMKLPVEVASTFFDIRDGDRDTRNAYIQELRLAGWTLDSISKASGLTSEGVRQIILKTGNDFEATDLYIPAVPEVVVADKVYKEYVEPKPETLARLLELQPLAQKVRGHSSVYRAEGEEYTALLHKAHTEEGVTIYRLGKRLGITHGAIRFRLARYGYKPSVNGKSKVYDGILAKNRVTI
jgi:hypothetical protein